ncbi:GATA transcription factor 8 [Phoenix dactylifera]|uniref:GATA transcription factor 8 n=1 Tax=Phoenix dactylifera TaxID=42345 RepID=A0A8B8JC26_PHODC|nr:GATA transcription factor 8 [Phoenix dactylifera]XP_026665473.1 GATA transcription factor 8 [Phoenix dactylifera]
MATGTKKYVDNAMARTVDVMCGDLFDHIDDLLDFPDDDDVRGMDDYQCGPAPPAPAPAFTPLLPPLHADGLLGGDGAGGGDSSDGSGDGAGGAASAFHRGDEKLAPWDDLEIAELEWLSSFFDDNDSFTVDFPKCNTAPTAAAATVIGTNDSNNSSGNSKEGSLFRTSSPVSVLEPNSLSIGGSGGGGSSSSSFSSSSSSCSGTGGGSSGARIREAPPISHPEPILAVPARARSKRPRPATFSSRPHVTVPFLPPLSDNIPAPTPVDSSSNSKSESFGESNPGPDTMKQKKKKKCSAGTAAGGDEAPPVRKCMHCEIQKTPQWRAGPMGPKTLCNACGVRYKSGRLFPEYRPAASPTFVPSLHSNSHRKVVEMRLEASHRAAAAGLPSPESASKDSCDLLAYIRRRE